MMDVGEFCTSSLNVKKVVRHDLIVADDEFASINDTLNMNQETRNQGF